MSVKSYKRVLVISNECFCQKSSNGRTLMNFFSEYDAGCLAQFYIHGIPEFSVCTNYYRVSDRDALQAFQHVKHYNKSGLVVQVGETSDENEKQGTINRRKKISKNCRNYCLRNLVWRSYRWWNAEFAHFLNDFRPEVVMLQAGDAPFLYHISRKIAGRFHAPLIMYNSENYVLKEVLYSGCSKYNLWHTVLQTSLRKQYSKTMEVVRYCIYSTEYLEESYQRAYPHTGKSSVMYITTEMDDCSVLSNETDIFSLVYCGNLGVGRVASLKKLANVLLSVCTTAKLDIYGSFLNDEDQKSLCEFENVVYHGMIPYAEVPMAIAKGSMVVHCENSDRLTNLKAAFSTKIADCLACGKPLLVFASREYPFVQYLEKNSAAHIAGDERELTEVIQRCIQNKAYRNQYLSNARDLAHKNHNILENAKKMKKIIDSI